MNLLKTILMTILLFHERYKTQVQYISEYEVCLLLYTTSVGKYVWYQSCAKPTQRGRQFLHNELFAKNKFFFYSWNPVLWYFLGKLKIWKFVMCQCHVGKSKYLEMIIFVYFTHDGILSQYQCEHCCNQTKCTNHPIVVINKLNLYSYFWIKNVQHHSWTWFRNWKSCWKLPIIGWGKVNWRY